MAKSGGSGGRFGSAGAARSALLKYATRINKSGMSNEEFLGRALQGGAVVSRGTGPRTIFTLSKNGNSVTGRIEKWEGSGREKKILSSRRTIKVDW